MRFTASLAWRSTFNIWDSNCFSLHDMVCRRRGFRCYLCASFSLSLFLSFFLSIFHLRVTPWLAIAYMYDKRAELKSCYISERYHNFRFDPVHPRRFHAYLVVSALYRAVTQSWLTETNSWTVCASGRLEVSELCPIVGDACDLRSGIAFLQLPPCRCFLLPRRWLFRHTLLFTL